MSTTTASSTNQATTQRIVAGVIGGLVGGAAFGVMMAAMNMLPMVGMLIGQENALVGLVVHLLISAFIGASFGILSNWLPAGMTPRLIEGGIYGIIWWVLGALVLMPLMLGMNAMVFVIGEAQIMSLIGHLIFGVLMGGVFHWFLNRRS